MRWLALGLILLGGAGAWARSQKVPRAEAKGMVMEELQTLYRKVPSQVRRRLMIALRSLLQGQEEKVNLDTIVSELMASGVSPTLDQWRQYQTGKAVEQLKAGRITVSWLGDALEGMDFEKGPNHVYLDEKQLHHTRPERQVLTSWTGTDVHTAFINVKNGSTRGWASWFKRKFKDLHIPSYAGQPLEKSPLKDQYLAEVNQALQAVYLYDGPTNPWARSRVKAIFEQLAKTIGSGAPEVVLMDPPKESPGTDDDAIVLPGRGFRGSRADAVEDEELTAKHRLVFPDKKKLRIRVDRAGQVELGLEMEPGKEIGLLIKSLKLPKTREKSLAVGRASLKPGGSSFVYRTQEHELRRQ